MRRLVVCCDGTWSTPSDATNVDRFFRALARTDEQVPEYFPGVGTDGGPLRRRIDGTFGLGLDDHVRRAYLWVAETWRPDDVLVLVGFSRGAYTVRSLAGVLTRLGLAVLGPGDHAAVVARVHEAYLAERTPADVTWQPGFGPDDVAPIAFLGVWDTVGALGVPRTFALLSRLTGSGRRTFRDTALDPDVRHARQALSLDEQRGPYVPSLWRTPPPGRHDSFAQVWFPGGHSDVGGGSDAGTGLSDAALRWMAEQATDAVGLTWSPGPRTWGPGDPCAPASTALTGLMRYLSPRPRPAPHVVAGNADVSESAVARRDGCGLVPPYRPGVVPAVGESRDVVVPAELPWPETGLWCPAGRYRFAVAGTWSDHGASTPATGFASWPVAAWPGYALGTLLGGLRRVLRTTTGDPRADVIGSRRVPGARWMELVVAVADDILHPDGTVEEGTTLPIGRSGTLEALLPRGGYLYAFANDAWTGYPGNAGAVTLTVTRLA